MINLTTKNKKCIEKLSVVRFDYPKFLEFGPVKVNFDLLNMGDVHAQPLGKIVLKDVFNSVVGQQNLKDQRIFPETAKTYSNTVGPQWLIGPFTVMLQATYGHNNTPLIYTTTLWIIPWRLILITLLALVIIFIIVRNIFGKVTRREEQLETKLQEEEKEISELKQILRGKKE